VNLPPKHGVTWVGGLGGGERENINFSFIFVGHICVQARKRVPPHPPPPSLWQLTCEQTFHTHILVGFFLVLMISVLICLSFKKWFDV